MGTQLANPEEIDEYLYDMYTGEELAEKSAKGQIIFDFHCQMVVGPDQEVIREVRYGCTHMDDGLRAAGRYFQRFPLDLSSSDVICKVSIW